MTAAASIQAIKGTASQSPQSQIRAIQNSGWASSRYPDFVEIYNGLDPTLKQQVGASVAQGAVAGQGGSGTVSDGSANTTYAFSVSGTDNPDEDYWTAINRLAQEVQWYLFSNGEYLYYLDGQEMLAQKPALVIDRVKDRSRFADNQLSASFDNTAYGYVSDHVRRARTQRRTKVAVAQSPTEVTMNLICGIEEIMGGDLVQLSGFGPADGSWVVAESRRSVFDTYSELTLVPPIAPITELAAVGTTSTSTSTSSSIVTPGGSSSATDTALSGTLRDKVVQAALAAVARQKASAPYHYPPGDVLHARPMPSSLLGPAPIYIDCSAFATLCYKEAGAPDPNALASTDSYIG